MKYYIIFALSMLSFTTNAQSNLEWMEKNLSVTSFQNGDSIQHVTNDEDWEKAGNDKIPAWTFQTVNDSVQTIVYNYYAVVDPRGLAPEGWRIPTIKELELLTIDVMGLSLCSSKNFGGTFSNSGLMIGFWSLSPRNDDYSYFLQYHEIGDSFSSDDGLNGLGFSVRCVKSK